MQKVALKAEKRDETGKGGARKLRSKGVLPGVLYSKGSSMPIKFLKTDISKLIGSGKGEHFLVTIELTGDKGKKKDHWALVKDYQLDPVKNELIHVDFMEVSLDKKIKITTPIILINEPIGVKNGGILQHQLRELEIECLPTQIPEGVEVDTSSINIGQSIHVSDLTVKEGIKILSNPQEVVLSIVAAVIEEVAPTAPAEQVITEPELVRKTKAKEEEEVVEEPKAQKEQKEQKEQKTQKEK